MVEKVHRDSSKKVKKKRDNMTEVSVVIPTKNEEKWKRNLAKQLFYLR